MSNRIFFWRWIGLLMAMLFMTACMQNLFDARRGKVAVLVKWPTKSGYSVMAIPADTVKVEVSIVGDGLDGTPVKETLTPSAQESSTDYIEVPIGPKVIEATAYDASDKVTADGYTTMDIRANTLNEAHVVLQAKTEVPVSDKSPDPRAVPDLTITTVAGSGLPGAQDGADPSAARFKYPQALALDAKAQALYIADSDYHLIRRYNLVTGVVTTVAGQTPTTDTQPSPSAAPALLGSSIGMPGGLALGPKGELYFSDRDNHVIRKLQPDGTVVTVAGTGKPGDKDGPNALQASFDYPLGVAADHDGNLYVADTLNQKIRRISPEGTVLTIAGNGQNAESGDGGQARVAGLSDPGAIALDPRGGFLYVAELKGLRVRRINLVTGVIDTVAGTGTSGVGGEGGSAQDASLSLPTALAFTPAGELLIADGWAMRVGPGNDIGYASRVLKLTTDGKLVRIAGHSFDTPGYGGDGGDALRAELNNPAGLAVDEAGNIYVADCFNNRVRLLTHQVVGPAPQPSASPSGQPAGSPAPTPASSGPAPTPSL